ncbi:Ferredoxin-NADP reductase [Nakamurella panacisegetis]|uniref:Ferredoxin-NADP reductase n=2 Tax=Nakamurella panacisegetis TaxID=1090615 RepID=A0A1H0SDI5_9ACTN|nr:Ferredoxin-NADP reductase [Nakamurella panacisegetis]
MDTEIGPGTGPAAPVGGWRTAVVREVEHPQPNAVRLVLDVPDRIAHLPGQHYIVRLRAEDGYTAQRSYSIASSPAQPGIELFVERLEDGEVSGFLADVVQVGDELEVRGPIGGWFVWRGDAPGLLVGGGTGVVPLVSMVRHARDVGRPDLLKVAVSARSLAELPYADELIAAGATVALSRTSDPSVMRAAGRLGPADLQPLVTGGPTAFVCGSTGFAEATSRLLIGAGVPSSAIRVERFGPTG